MRPDQNLQPPGEHDEFVLIRRGGQTLSFTTPEALVAFVGAILYQSDVPNGRKRLLAMSEMLAKFASAEVTRELTK